jgi:hypothetical protein
VTNNLRATNIPNKINETEGENHLEVAQVIYYN